MFQKRHMEAIATAMQSVKPNPTQKHADWQWHDTVRTLADMLQQSNPRFDVARFERACEPGANVSKRSA